MSEDHASRPLNFPEDVFDKCHLIRDRRLTVEPKGTLAVAKRRQPVDPFACDLCNGIRQVSGFNDEGYRFLKPCPGAHFDRRIRRFNEARLPARYHNATFESFETQHHGPLEDTLMRLQDYVAAFEAGQRGLVLMGKVGTGKTHLLIACLRYLTLAAGVECRFVEFTHLLSEIRTLYGTNRSEAELLDPLIHVKVLAIDELGKGRNSEFEHRIVDELISRRYNEMGTTTLFTTNYVPREFSGQDAATTQPWQLGATMSAPTEYLADRIGERPTSRLFEMCDFIEVNGPDYRRQRHF